MARLKRKSLGKIFSGADGAEKSPVRGVSPRVAIDHAGLSPPLPAIFDVALGIGKTGVVRPFVYQSGDAAGPVSEISMLAGLA